jgi:predicted phosphodiesterase
MRIAVISDIHGNLAALESVFSYIDSAGVDEIYCLGDTVGYGPYPNECIELVNNRCKGIIIGNHDWGACGKIHLRYFNKFGRTALKWTIKRISKENIESLLNLPLKIINDRITFVHASPMNPENWTYIVSDREATEAFQGFTTQLCFGGHTHLPALISEDPSAHTLQKDKRFLINVGSVGQPRDGNSKTSFGIIDTDRWSYELVRLDYDIQRTYDAIIKFGLPQILGKRLLEGF